MNNQALEALATLASAAAAPGNSAAGEDSSIKLYDASTNGMRNLATAPCSTNVPSASPAPNATSLLQNSGMFSPQQLQQLLASVSSNSAPSRNTAGPTPNNLALLIQQLSQGAMPQPNMNYYQFINQAQQSAQQGRVAVAVPQAAPSPLDALHALSRAFSGQSQTGLTSLLGKYRFGSRTVHCV